MPKCRNIKCGEELKNTSFVKDDDGEVVLEHYICENEECELYHRLQTFPHQGRPRKEDSI